MTDDQLLANLASAFRAERGPDTRASEVRLLRFARVAAPEIRRSRTHRLTALALVCLCGSVGTAAAVVPHGFRIGGVEVFVRNDATVASQPERSVPQLPPVAPRATESLSIPGDAAVWPGEPVTIEEGTRRYRARIRLPKALRGPKAVFWMKPPKSGQITAVWSPSSALPALADPKVGLLLTQFRGSARSEPIIIKKTDVSRSQFETVTVNKSPGSWIEGAHTVVIVDASGERRETSRLAGNTLLWADGMFTYRLEGAISKSEALRIARSMK